MNGEVIEGIYKDFVISLYESMLLEFENIIEMMPEHIDKLHNAPIIVD